MNVIQLNDWRKQAFKFSDIADNYTQRIAAEIQKFCDFEIKFGEIDPSDGIVLCYDSEDYTDCHISLDRIIELYMKKNKKLALNDLRGEY